MAKSSYHGANVTLQHTFAGLVGKVNELIGDSATIQVTTTPAAVPNTTNAGVTVGNAHIDGNLSANVVSTPTLTGGTAGQPGNLTVASNTTFSSNVTANGRTTLNGVVSVNANASVTGTDLTVAANTAITGTLSVNNALMNVKSTSVVVASNTTTVNSNTVAVTSNSVSVTAPVSVSGNTTVTGKLTVTGDASITGNTVIGDNYADIVQLKAKLSGNVIPANTSVAIGSTAEPINSIVGRAIEANTYLVKTRLETANATPIVGTGNTTAYGKLQLGVRSTTDKIVAELDSTSVAPPTNAEFDLGKLATRWKTLYVNNIDAAGVTGLQSLTVANDATINGPTTFAANVTAQQNVVITGNLTVSGETFLSSNNSLTLNASAVATHRVTSILYSDGNTVLGDSNADITTFNSKINSDIVPSGTTRNLGSATEKWNAVYASNVIGSVSWSNVVSRPSPILGITLTGDATGTGSMTMASLGSANVSIAVSVPQKIVTLGTQTAGDYVASAANGAGIVITNASASNSAALTIAHADTSSVANTSTSSVAGSAITGVTATFDSFGHVVSFGATTTSFDTRYPLSSVKTLTIDGNSIVANTREDAFNITTSSNLKSTVNTASKTVELDVSNTVVLTSGAQDIGGAKSFLTPLVIKNASNRNLQFHDNLGGTRAYVFQSAADDKLRIRQNVSGGSTAASQLAFGADGDITVETGRLVGDGSGLSNINATALTGTIASARLPSDVVKTSGDQSISGIKTFTGSVSLKNSGNRVIYFRDESALNRAAVYHDNNGDHLALQQYAANGSVVTTKLTLDVGGDIKAEIGRFSGSGAGLTNIPSSSLTGIIPNSLISGAYSGITTLDTTGRMTVTNAGEALRLNGPAATDNPFITFYAGSVRTAYIQHTDGTGVGSGLRVFNDVTDDYLYLSNVNSVDALKFYDSSTSSHNTVWHSGNLTASDITSLYGFYPTTTGRSITAGAGLTGGGDFSANRAIALGTPSSITSTSTNSVTDTSHTHFLSEKTVRTLLADGTAGDVGTYALLRKTDANFGKTNATTAGSNLYYASASAKIEHPGLQEPTRPSGAWRCMGLSTNYSNTTNDDNVTLWLRIA